MFGSHRAPRVIRTNLGLSGAIANANTVEIMRKQIRQSKVSPEIRALAEALVRECPENGAVCEVRRIFEFVRDNVRYTKDPRGFEFFKTPDLHLQQLDAEGIAYGDCDDFTVLLGALLGSIGYRVRITVMRSPGAPAFHHVFPEVFILGRWMALDATLKSRPIFSRAPAAETKSVEVA